MANYATHISEKISKPQSEKAREDQVANNAGGYVFQLDPWATLDRFLILGCEGNTYYATEREMTVENARGIQALLNIDGKRVVDRIVEISDTGRAPKNDPALFALALAACANDAAVRVYALDALPKVARIGTHLLTFVDFADKLRGWGRGLRRAVANWYRSFEPQKLAIQVAKYQSRTKQGSKAWSQRDLLRKCHVRTANEKQNLALRWAVGKANDAVAGWQADADLRYLYAHDAATKATDEAQIVRLIADYGLMRESVPTQWLNDRAVWDALLNKMPLGAMVRNLGKMTLVGSIGPLADGNRIVCDALTNQELIHKSRLHPLAILIALKTYAQGHGMRGGNTWNPAQPVIDALDKAFYLAFANVTPTGKRFLLGIDVSGSMDSGSVAGSPLTPREGAMAMAMSIARSESNYHMLGFSDRLVPIPVTASTSLQDACRIAASIPMGGTDCALPMIHAQKNGIPVDCFVVITDNETWAGATHPFQALREYRKATGINARLVVMGMTATEFTIADPSDRGMLDVVGMDAATPDLVSQFAAGLL